MKLEVPAFARSGWPRGRAMRKFHRG